MIRELTGARTCLGPRVSGVGLNYLPWGPDDDLHLCLALGESDRFSQAIGACDEQVRTRDENAPCRNGRPGIARELQSPSRGVSRSARGRLFRNSESVGRRLCTVLAAARIPRAGGDQRGLCVLAGAA